MDTKVKDSYEYVTLVEEELSKAMNSITLILVLFYAEEQAILKKEEYELAAYGAMKLLERIREDLSNLNDLNTQFQSNISREKKDFPGGSNKEISDG